MWKADTTSQFSCATFRPVFDEIRPEKVRCFEKLINLNYLTFLIAEFYQKPVEKLSKNFLHLSLLGRYGTLPESRQNEYFISSIILERKKSKVMNSQKVMNSDKKISILFFLCFQLGLCMSLCISERYAFKLWFLFFFLNAITILPVLKKKSYTVVGIAHLKYILEFFLEIFRRPVLLKLRWECRNQ